MTFSRCLHSPNIDQIFRKSDNRFWTYTYFSETLLILNWNRMLKEIFLKFQTRIALTALSINAEYFHIMQRLIETLTFPLKIKLKILIN